MNPLNLLVIVLVGLLVACAPTTGESQSSNDAITPESPTATNESESPLKPVQPTRHIAPSAEVDDSNNFVEEEHSQAAEPLPGSEGLIEKAKQMIQQLPGVNVDIESVSLVSIQQMQWRDSSLGCPRNGLMYMQVITPGYLIFLQADNKQYEFHTNLDQSVILCSIDGLKIE